MKKITSDQLNTLNKWIDTIQLEGYEIDEVTIKHLVRNLFITIEGTLQTVNFIIDYHGNVKEKPEIRG